MKIFIDADGCPVVDLTVKKAKQHSLECYIICDTAHEFNKDGAQTIIVEKGADSADFRLVNLVSAGDIVVTQDYGLAAMCLAKKAVPLSQNGLVFTDKNIDELLFSRYVSKKIRNAGGRLKGPSKRTAEQDERFVQALENLIQ
ncbi:MAG: YaiI/YqxD family protein [Clostridia bacterium]|nr:YaiI/YqxD family protein [Clostridia bacterium]